MSTRTEYDTALKDELALHGVTRSRIVNGGKHKKLCFTFNGRKIQYVYPATPSDSYRGVKNCVTELRKVMGVKRVTNKNPENRRRKTTTAERAPECPYITTKPNPFTPLESIVTQEDIELEALIDRAGREDVFAEVLSGGWRAESVVPHQVWRNAAQEVLRRNQRGVHGNMEIVK